MKLFLFVFALFSTQAHGGICNFGTKIFFGNGMFNTRVEAEQSRKILSQFDLAYNRNESKVINAISAIVQKLNNNYKTAWRIIFGLETPPPPRDPLGHNFIDAYLV